MDYDGNEAGGLTIEESQERQAVAASSPAVLIASNKLYEAALAVRSAGSLYASDLRDYLQPALQQLSREVARAAERSRVPAIERPTPSVIQRGPDPAADLLRAAARGENIQFR